MKPMSIGTAIEVMKILRPHVDELVEAKDGPDLIVVLSKGFARDNTAENIGRLIALMEGKTFDEISERFKKHPTGGQAYEDLVRGFSLNPIPDLIDAGFVLGILDRGWSKGLTKRAKKPVDIREQQVMKSNEKNQSD
jgi:hypothetical protein